MARFLVMGIDGIIEVMKFKSFESGGTVETDEAFRRGYMYVTTSDNNIPVIDFTDDITTSECVGKHNVVEFSDFDGNGNGMGSNWETSGLSDEEEESLEEEGIDWIFDELDQDGEYHIFSRGMELYTEAEKFLGTYWKGSFHEGKTESELFNTANQVNESLNRMKVLAGVTRLL